ncbi:MAG: transcriptional repressor LexA [Pseudomonadota bacterium]
MELTARQKGVLEFIRDHHERFGIPPSVREICANLGLRGPAGIHRILNVLIAKGYLTAIAGKKRSWCLTNTAKPRIPVLGRIAAGTPIEAIADNGEDLPLDPEIFGCDECFVLRVQGDSMVDAHIIDGDFAVIRPQDIARSGEVVAVMVECLLPEATLKTLRRKRNVTELHAENSAYPPLVFKGREQKRIRIIGKFVGLVRRG